MESYRELTNRQHLEFQELPIFWAYNNEQFTEGMESIGLTMSDTDKLNNIGHGGYIQKTNWYKIEKLTNKHDLEFKKALVPHKTNDIKTSFAYEMFLHELENHEYCISGSTEDTLEAIGLKLSDIEKNPFLTDCLSLAMNECDSNSIW